MAFAQVLPVGALPVVGASSDAPVPRRPTLSVKLDELASARVGDPRYGGILLDLMTGVADAKAGVIAEVAAGDGTMGAIGGEAIVASKGDTVVLASAGGAAVPIADTIRRAVAVGHAHMLTSSVGIAGAIAVPLVAVPGRIAAAILELGTERAPFALALALERLELLAAVHRANAERVGGAASIELAAIVQRLVGRGTVPSRAQAFADAARDHMNGAGSGGLGGEPGAAFAFAAISGRRVARLTLAGQRQIANTSATAFALRSQIKVAIARQLDGAVARSSEAASQDGSSVSGQWTVALIRDGARILGALAAPTPADPAQRDLVAHRLDRLADAASPYVDAGGRAPSLSERWSLLSADPQRRRYALLSMAATGLVLAMPLPDRVAAPFRLEAVETRTVTAPYDGQLEAVLVKANDKVTAGQTVLARLATREIDLSLSTNEANRASAMTERAIAQTAQKPAEARAAELKAQKADAEIALLTFRRSLAEVKSPIDGTVVKADVQRQAGSVVSRGQVLFEVADPRALAADILIPDEDIVRIEAGQPGILSPAAEPGAAYPFRIERVHPSSETVGTRTVFRARAVFDGPLAPRLKTGMEGAARVHTGYAPFGWLMIRDAVNAARRWLWI
ncbi:MAG: HlyD family efflux transporter periplasmic adaptor subunit [Hyphomicrobium aestuarii]|nr:HlyD family efflux transporter periplasmic adaptor subunit [Hyphomicrobium aestuarii]